MSVDSQPRKRAALCVVPERGSRPGREHPGAIPDCFCPRLLIIGWDGEQVVVHALQHLGGLPPGNLAVPALTARTRTPRARGARVGQ